MSSNTREITASEWPQYSSSDWPFVCPIRVQNPGSKTGNPQPGSPEPEPRVRTSGNGNGTSVSQQGSLQAKRYSADHVKKSFVFGSKRLCCF